MVHTLSKWVRLAATHEVHRGHDLIVFIIHHSGGGGGGHSGTVVTPWPSTSQVGGSNLRPHVRKLVVAYHWSAVYLDQMYVLVCSAHKTTHRDMTFTVLKVMQTPK